MRFIPIGDAVMKVFDYRDAELGMYIKQKPKRFLLPASGEFNMAISDSP